MASTDPLGPQARAACAAFESWMFESALPLWSTLGRDRPGLGFIEHLTPSAVPANVPYKRVRVQARQIYVFSHASLLGRPGAREGADDGYAFLTRHAWRADGSWARCLGREGGVLDAAADLYDMAFVLLALAWYARATGAAEPIDRAHRTLEWIEQTMASPLGGFHNAWPVPDEPRQQNPHMHLLEAALALFVTTGDRKFLRLADTLVDLFRQSFFDPATGTLGEFFTREWDPADGAAGSHVEPGHHYEWVWILTEYERLSGRSAAPCKGALYAFANQFGRRPENGLVVAVLDRTGSVRDASTRIWPQTEAIKAHVVMAECGVETVSGRPLGAIIAEVVGNLLQRFFAREPAGTWTDHLASDGVPKSDRIPASSLYHIFMAFAELDRVVGKRARPGEHLGGTHAARRDS